MREEMARKSSARVTRERRGVYRGTCADLVSGQTTRALISIHFDSRDRPRAFLYSDWPQHSFDCGFDHLFCPSNRLFNIVVDSRSA